MKFISFIASTMLIVLISQYSVMGLPITDKSGEEPCPEGLEKIDGQCVPISSTTSGHATDSETSPITPMIMEEKQPTAKLTPLRKYGACPEGMEHGEHGICHKIKSSETTITNELNVESTTLLNNDKHDSINLLNCPEGTKRDQDGACQDIKPLDTKKQAMDPKILLQADGSCPDNYKMIEGRCLYIKPKINSTLPLRPFIDDIPSGSPRPRDGKDQTSQSEAVPVLPDGSCPERTEYIEFGLCQKLARPSKINRSCPDNYEFIHNKCLPKNLPQRLESTTLGGLPETEPTTSTSMPLTEQPKDHIETFKPTEIIETTETTPV